MMLRFRLRTLLIAVALLAVIVAIGSQVSIVLAGSVSVAFVLYLAARMLACPLTIVLAVLATLLCLPPWFGVPGYRFACPGTELEMPTINIGSAAIVFDPVYDIAEWPVRRLGRLNNEAYRFVYFPGEGLVTVQPFAVFMIWLLVAIVLWCAVLPNRSHPTR